MSLNLLPETESIVEVLRRPAFVLTYTPMAMVLIGVSYFLENASAKNASAAPFFVHKNTYVDVLSYTFLLSMIAFSNAYQITGAIASGRSPRISLRRLQSLPWPMNTMCGFSGDPNFIKFVGGALCFPGLATVVTLHLLSYYVNGAEGALEWRMPLRLYLASSTLWRLYVGSIIYVLNYLAAHNPTQSIFTPSEDSDQAPQPPRTSGSK